MTGSFRVLVVDDDRLGRVTTAKQLQNRGYESMGAEDAYRATQLLRESAWDVVLTDLRMPGMGGLEFLRNARAEWPDIEVIVMTAFASVETAVEAMQSGAADYLVKPFQLDELDLRLRKIRELKDVRSELQSLHALLDHSVGSFGLVGRSPAMREVYERIEMFAEHEAPVLITGETGTGKELVARALHRGGQLRGRPFVPIACGAIPRDLAESELFGHEKGAFTGAHQRRVGSFGRADGGTVLLDDVDDLPLNIQVKLLRALQESKILRVGGTEELSISVRVLATSKIDLATAVTEGQFRDDLFYRLRGLEIHLPPLRRRGDDFLLLARHFLQLLAARGGGEPKTISPEAAAILRGYHWPGNVRELRRAMESAHILCRGDAILPPHLPAFVSTQRQDSGRHSLFRLALDGLEAVDFQGVVQNFEDALIHWAMAEAGGQQKRAAALLGMPRTTLQSKLNRMQEKESK